MTLRVISMGEPWQRSESRLNVKPSIRTSTTVTVVFAWTSFSGFLQTTSRRRLSVSELATTSIVYDFLELLTVSVSNNLS